MEEGETSSNLPPPYSKLSQSTSDFDAAKDVEQCTEPTLDSVNTFENKNARVMFNQKVLTVFLLQAVAVDLMLETFLYFEVFDRCFDVTSILVVSCAMYLASVVLLIHCDQARYKPPLNYMFLVYQPFAVSFISVLGMRAVLGVSETGQETLEMISLAWKAYIFAGPVLLLYTVFSLDSEHEFRLRNTMFIATGVFILTYICTLPYVSKYWNGPFTVLYTNLAFFPIYLYILYDIDAMTRGYHLALTPTDYINGAVNLSIDFWIYIRNFLSRICSCCVY